MDRRRLLFAGMGVATTPLLALLREWRAGRYARVGGTEVDEVIRLAGEIRSTDARMGGGAVLDQAMEALPWAKALIDANPGPGVRERLHHAVARLAEQIGFVAADAGNSSMARRCWQRGLDALDQMPDDEHFRSLRTRIHASVAREAAWSGRHDEARKADGETLRASLPSAEPATQALGWATSARVHAAQGNRAEALRAIKLADGNFARVDDAPEWLAFKTRPTLLADTGHAFCDLVIAGHEELAREAENRTLEAAALLMNSHARTRTLTEVVEMRMLVRSGRHDYAADLGRHVLPGVGGLQSRRVETALRRLRADLPDSAVVVDLRRQIDEALAI